MLRKKICSIFFKIYLTRKPKIIQHAIVTKESARNVLCRTVFVTFFFFFVTSPLVKYYISFGICNLNSCLTSTLTILQSNYFEIDMICLTSRTKICKDNKTRCKEQQRQRTKSKIAKWNDMMAQTIIFSNDKSSNSGVENIIEIGNISTLPWNEFKKRQKLK